MEIYVKISLFCIFSLFFSFLIMILSYTLILPMLQRHTQQLMTSHIEYLMWTYNILVLILFSKLVQNIVAMAGFNTIWLWFLIVAYFLGHVPCIIYNIICIILFICFSCLMALLFVANNFSFFYSRRIEVSVCRDLMPKMLFLLSLHGLKSQFYNPSLLFYDANMWRLVA